MNLDKFCNLVREEIRDNLERLSLDFKIIVDFNFSVVGNVECEAKMVSEHKYYNAQSVIVLTLNREKDINVDSIKSTASIVMERLIVDHLYAILRNRMNEINGYAYGVRLYSPWYYKAILSKQEHKSGILFKVLADRHKSLNHNKNTVPTNAIEQELTYMIDMTGCNVLKYREGSPDELILEELDVDKIRKMETMIGNMILLILEDIIKTKF